MTASVQTHYLLTCMVAKLFTKLQILELCLFLELNLQNVPRISFVFLLLS